jgi:hypothetical protein
MMGLYTLLYMNMMGLEILPSCSRTVVLIADQFC